MRGRTEIGGVVGAHRHSGHCRQWLSTLALTVGFAHAHAARADTPAPLAAEALRALDLEALAEIPITAVSRREEPANRAAASVFVLLGDEIVRSGARTLPDALRLVPGMHVARINAHAWAVSARGFNKRFADKLLVLIDGRSVYTPLYSGVYWSAHDVPIEEIDRIEVIRGPGGTLWGANAVNGIVNVITKSAAATRGTTVRVAGGSEPQADVYAQHSGGGDAPLTYRLSVRHTQHAAALLAEGAADAGDGGNAADGWRNTTAGLRLDWAAAPGTDVSLTAGAHTARLDQFLQSVSTSTPPFSQPSSARSRSDAAFVAGRLDQGFGRRGTLTVNLSLERAIEGISIVDDRRTTADLDVHHTVWLGQRLAITAGASHRQSWDDIKGVFQTTFVPSRAHLRWWGGFAEGQLHLWDSRVRLAAGAKAERNAFTAWEFMPSARASAQPLDRLGLWAAVTRSVRTPSRLDNGVVVNATVFPAPTPDARPTLLQTRGNPNVRAESLDAFELGVRATPDERVSFDAAVFYHRYHDLIAARSLPLDTQSGAPMFDVSPRMYFNDQKGHSYGGEVSLLVQVLPSERVSLGYSHLHVSVEGRDDSANTLASRRDPRHQAVLRSSTTLGERTAIDVIGRYVGRLDALAVDSHFTADVRIGVRAQPWLEIEAVGRNLTKARHAEYRSPSQVPATDVAREAFLGVTMRP